MGLMDDLEQLELSIDTVKRGWNLEKQFTTPTRIPYLCVSEVPGPDTDAPPSSYII